MAKKKDETSQVPPGEETPPEDEPGTTSEVEPTEPEEETFSLTQAEIDAKVNAGRSDLGRQLSDALAGNQTLKTGFDVQGTRITDLEGTITKMRDRERQKEIDGAEGDKGLVSEIKLKHDNEDKELDISRREAALTQSQAQHQADIDSIAKGKAKELAKELAKTSGLAESLILDIGTDTADGRTTYNLERMKTVASKAPKGKGEVEDEEVDEEDDEAVAAAANAKLRNQKGQKARAASTSRSSATKGFRTFQDYEEAYGRSEISIEQYEEAAKRFNVQL